MPRRYRRTSWKIFQLSQQAKRKLRLLGLAVLVLVSTAAVFAFLSFYHYLKQPLAAAASGLVFDRRGDGGSRFDLLLIILSETGQVKELSVLTAGSGGGPLTLLKLPSVRREAVSSGPFALPDLQRSVSRRLGVSFDGYLLATAAGEQRLSQFLGGPLNLANLRKLAAPLNWLKAAPLLVESKGDLKTNLSLFDLAKLAKSVWSTRFDKAEEVELEEVSEQFLTETFSEGEIVEEGSRIIILNGTETSGLAAQAARLTAHLGGHVLDVANAPRVNYPESFLITNGRSPYTEKRLAEIFKITRLKEMAGMSGDPLFHFFQRADLVVLLGLDSVARL